MRTARRIRTLCFAVTLCAALAFAGCGRKETAPLSEGGENLPAAPGAKPAEAPLEQQTEQKLDPLSKDDVELYLKVMRAAAGRVNNPAPGDTAALETAKRILAGRASRHVPTPDDVKTLERANLVALSMDQIVANEMKIDARTYRGIAEAIESVIRNPALSVASGDGGPPEAVGAHATTPLEKRLSDVNAVNQRFLAPYREQIQGLIAIVRNPANLPK
jgi:hypothetical protein